MFSSQQEILFTIVTIIGSLFIVFILFLIFTLVNQRKVVALQKKLLRAEILSIEKERERVASDLHDSLGSALASLALATNKVNTADAESEKIKQDVSYQLIEVNEQVRQISRDLIPRFYVETTVKDVIEKVGKGFELILQEKGIQFFVITDVTISLSKENHLHLFRIAHELVNNGYKHSQATIINLSCFLKEGVLVLSYTDNGIGYDKEVMEDGLGLSSIQNRIGLLNGSYSITTGKGKGTDIQLRIPV